MDSYNSSLRDCYLAAYCSWELLMDQYLMYYLNKKRRRLVAMNSLDMGDGLIKGGYLFRDFDYDDKSSKFVFKREYLLSYEEAKARLDRMRQGTEWAPLASNRIESYVDYGRPPMKESIDAVQVREATQVYVRKPSGDRGKMGGRGQVKEEGKGKEQSEAKGAKG